MEITCKNQHSTGSLLHYHLYRFNQFLTQLKKVLLGKKNKMVHTTSNSLFINPLILRGFVSIQWNKLPGIGIISGDETWKSISDLSDLIDMKVQEKTAELEDSKKELESFGYSISHDLKAPLRVINGYCTILKNSPEMMSDEATEIFERINGSAQKMGKLIDDLLRFSVVQSGNLTKQRTDMNALIKSVIFELKVQNTTGSRIIIHRVPDAYCDGSLVRQVWINLISNAIKYSANSRKPIVEIGADLSQVPAVYYVKDNGSGFDMKFACKLFKPFQRLHSGDAYEGTGIGLALSHRIVARHGGKIWTEAKVNEGAKFYFTL
ncbi:MAG: sensor hybrid histidine kinase [Bacteroidetes bacterium]|nr:sensor hybrid histidine kinase [Bacteroidota bacterium]